MHAELQVESETGKPLLSVVGGDDEDKFFLRSLPGLVLQNTIALRATEKKGGWLEIFRVLGPGSIQGVDARRVKRLYKLKLGNRRGVQQLLAEIVETAGFPAPDFDPKGNGEAVFDFRNKKIGGPFPPELFARRIK